MTKFLQKLLAGTALVAVSMVAANSAFALQVYLDGNDGTNHVTSNGNGGASIATNSPFGIFAGSASASGTPPLPRPEPSTNTIVAIQDTYVGTYTSRPDR
ncbi:MAG: hypothetical protein ACJ8AW_02060 [Rhodopila sp.]